MEIVAFDTDDKADGSGKAKITWISKNVLKTQNRMKPSGSGYANWDNSGMKSYLQNIIAPLVPQEVMDSVVSVKKHTRIYTSSTSSSKKYQTNETLWIPSRREISGEGSSSETDGVIYSTAFPDSASLVKGVLWWLRTASSSTSFFVVDKNNGSIAGFSMSS